MQIRAVRPEEYEEAGAVVVAAYRLLDADLAPADAAELADVGRRAPEAEVLVAVDERVIGCVTFVPGVDSRWAEQLEADESAIRMFGVDPAVQGRGVGRVLLDACIERAEELGRRGLFLHSTPWMSAAHRLYQNAGFVRVSERDWVPMPEVPLWAFRLDLGAPRLRA